jgi:hypothetical protein
MRFISCSFAITSLLVIASYLSAQDTAPQVGGPVMGYVFDSQAGNIRPILGMPGASTLGDPLNVQVSVSSAVISPTQDFALATIGDEGTPAVLPLDGDMTTGDLSMIVTINSASAEPSRMVLSPSGTAAALYYEGQGTLQLVTGLPSAPVVAGEIQLGSLGSPLTSLAVNDGGSMVLVALAGNGAGSVLLVRNDGSQQNVFNAGGISAVAFLATEDSAIIADQHNNSIYLLKNLTGSLETTVIGDARDGLSAPIDVSVSGDNRQGIVLNSDGGVVMLDLAGGPSRLLNCSCRPTHLDRLRGRSVYRLTDVSTEPVWLLDGDRSVPAIVFVPSPNTDSQAGALTPGQDGGAL